MKRETKNEKLIYFLIVTFLGWLGIHKFLDGKIGMGILYIFTCGLFFIGWLVDFIRALVDWLTYKEPENLYSVAQENYQQPIIDNPLKKTHDVIKVSFEGELDDGKELGYFYKDVHFCNPDKFPDDAEPGEEIYLIQEPDNPYDENAVLVCGEDDRKLGYLYRGKMQRMVNDYLENDDCEIKACAIDLETIAIGFYK